MKENNGGNKMKEETNKQTKDPFLGSMKEITFSKFGPDWFLKSAKGEGKAKDFASVGTKYKCVCCDKEIGAVSITAQIGRAHV